MTETPNTFLLQNGQMLVFIGDSITDCGRRDQAFPLKTRTRPFAPCKKSWAHVSTQ